MVYWKEDIIKKVREKEIKGMKIDFTKKMKKISEEFDKLYEEIKKYIGYDPSIEMQKFGGDSGYLRKLKILGIEYNLHVSENEISIICYKDDKCISHQIYRVTGNIGEEKFGQYLRNDQIKKPSESDMLEDNFFDYNEILDNLMNRAYEDVMAEMNRLKLQKIREGHNRKRW